MKQRIVTAIILAAVLIPLVIFGHHFHLFAIASGILAAIAAYEFRKMLQKKHPLPLTVDLLAILLTVGFYIVGYLALTDIIPLRILGLYLLFTSLFVMTLFIFIPELSTPDCGNLLLTMLYCGLGFLGLAFCHYQSRMLLITVLLIAILTDTSAYFFGIRFGRHRLAVKISPKKSVEGAVAGLVIGGGAGGLFAILLAVFPFPDYVTLLLSFGLSFLAQVGDLVASKFKRNHDIKDFSNLLPGHGGILDRFDSWMFIAANLMVIGLFIESIFPLVQVF
ncbi:MAG: phosphatidate cytidylyltransferase [Candidatus Izemoplasmatales bacterium]|jgi:phosphatidate cytidylyltransferase|nr:phosphatidate cytidylyltransferase [Candidatus Izemoplasmatales bacterium]